VSVQQQRAAQQLHSVADELHAMAANGGQSGLATEVARQAADRVRGAASWLEQREPSDLLEEVRRFARRRPGTFLIGAAVAGVAAGRLTRGLAARSNQDQGTGRGTTGGMPAAGTGYSAASPYAAEAGPYPPAAPVYPASPTFTPAPGYVEDAQPAGPGAPAYPAEPPYPYPADAGRTADPVGPGGTAPYPRDPAYPVDPAYPDPVHPPEPGAGPRDGGSR
jgi:hypothetical protein